MKPEKKGNKKLRLNRVTIAHLDIRSMNIIQGGAVNTTINDGNTPTTGFTKELQSCITCPSEYKPGVGD
jgi:hypothetical protein